MLHALLLLVCIVLAVLAPSAATASSLHEPARAEASKLTRAACTHPIASSIGSETIASSHAQARPNPLVSPSALLRSRAGRRPSTNKGEAAGEAGWEGAHREKAAQCAPSASNLAERARQLNQQIGPRGPGSQRQLLDNFFKGNIGPEQVETQTFHDYAEIARITQELKGDSLGEQARRLELIDQVLQNR